MARRDLLTTSSIFKSRSHFFLRIYPILLLCLRWQQQALLWCLISRLWSNDLLYRVSHWKWNSGSVGRRNQSSYIKTHHLMFRKRDRSRWNSPEIHSIPWSYVCFGKWYLIWKVISFLFSNNKNKSIIRFFCEILGTWYCEITFYSISQWKI